MGQLGDILLECIGLDLCQRGMMDKKNWTAENRTQTYIWDGYVFQKRVHNLSF